MKKPSGGAGDILNSPQAAQILKNKSALLNIMNSPEGKKLQQLLTKQSGGDQSLQNTAQSAAQGDASAAAELLNFIKNNPESAALLEQIAKQLSK
ncbi:MAG: hypothetical protein PHT34_04165 [Oscillospiraceae bacterium]|nr:hypothetical protein [Oscillospiraceae bacterium]